MGKRRKETERGDGERVRRRPRGIRWQRKFERKMREGKREKRRE